MQAPAAKVETRVRAVAKAGRVEPVGKVAEPVGKVAQVEHRSRMVARSTARWQMRLTVLSETAARAAGR